jgi:hypothetical protein
VDTFFGRVSERGLLDTEIQTETRQLISIPNTFLITHPVSVIRNSGTIVSASLTLGYDVHHSRISGHLKEAALAAGLEEPFVHVTELGNYAVGYRVNGLLKDVKSLLTAKSHLHEAVLDSLHRGGIEIVSPNFMNQRPLPDGTLIIPKRMRKKLDGEETAAEEIVFDKAEEAEKKEFAHQQLVTRLTELEEALKAAPSDERKSLEERIKQTREAMIELEKNPPKPDKES